MPRWDDKEATHEVVSSNPHGRAHAHLRVKNSRDLWIGTYDDAHVQTSRGSLFFFEVARLVPVAAAGTKRSSI